MKIRGFKYSKQTGNLYRNFSPGNNGIGKIGVINRRATIGYKIFYYKNKQVYAHRFIYELVTGEKIPKGFVTDHINGIRHDNRWANLRIVSQRENISNTYLHRNGKLLGANFRENLGLWVPTIWINGKVKYLGRFKTKEEAHKAYMEARRNLEKHKKGNDINA